MASVRSGAFLTLLLLLCSPLAAQAPRITEGGDPSIDADTIYALVVDPADHRDEHTILLLDDGVIVLEADGRATETYRTVVQILTRDAVSAMGELTFSYDGVRDDFRVNWVRVISSDGRVISDSPAHQQVMDMPVAQQSPVFTDSKLLRMSLAGVEPGAIVDYSTTRVIREPARPSDFHTSWLITTGSTVRRSRLLVETPADYELRIDATAATAAPVIEVAGDRKVYGWFAHDLPMRRAEPFADYPADDAFQQVQISAPSSWSDIGAWYGRLASDRYELTPEILAAAEREVGGATGEAALRRLYRWVAQDFRYVSISLGIGGYQPRSPAEVWQTTSGDCKDKATLFIALARHYGFEAHPVLLASMGGIHEKTPSIRQFDHVIAAVRIEDEWRYLDLTAELIPFDEISPGYQNEFGLIVLDDGQVEAIRFPGSDAEDNLTRMRVEGELFGDGGFRGLYVEQHTGTMQYGFRSTMSATLSEREMAVLGDRVAQLVEGGRGAATYPFDGLDLEATPSMGVMITSARATRPNVGGGQIFFLPMANYADPGLVDQLSREPPRQLPISMNQVLGPVTLSSVLKLTIPEGWTATLPANVIAESRFGLYESLYVQEGRLLTVARRFSGVDGTAPEEAFPELVEWVRQIAEDDVPFLLLTPGE